MTLVSIRLDDALLEDMREKAKQLHLSQTDYIRQAITHMNHEIEKQVREQMLRKASLRVRKGSMEVNAEFDEIEHDPD